MWQPSRRNSQAGSPQARLREGVNLVGFDPILEVISHLTAQAGPKAIRRQGDEAWVRRRAHRSGWRPAVGLSGRGRHPGARHSGQDQPRAGLACPILKFEVTGLATRHVSVRHQFVSVRERPAVHRAGEAVRIAVRWTTWTALRIWCGVEKGSASRTGPSTGSPELQLFSALQREKLAMGWYIFVIMSSRRHIVERHNVVTEAREMALRPWGSRHGHRALFLVQGAVISSWSAPRGAASRLTFRSVTAPAGPDPPAVYSRSH